MMRMVTIAQKKAMPFIQLVGDQPVYALIVQLKNENPIQFDCILPFLGPFHAQCSFISAINKRFKGSGLADILVAAGVIVEGSVDRALLGKHYKRGVRCLRLMYEMLMRRAIQKACGEGLQLTTSLSEKLEELHQAPSREDRQKAYNELEGSAELVEFVEKTFEKLQDSESPMAKFWLSFMEMVEILMQNIHSLRTQNWEAFKESLRMMLPWLRIYDNDKYGRWLVEFWLEISSLPVEKVKYMMDGLFAQSMTGKAYSCLPLDLWIEMTMNKGSKMKAGWKQILKNETMLLTHTQNANNVNRVRASLHAIAKLKATPQQHAENSTNRMRIDEKAVQDLDCCINEFDSDPFDLSTPALRSLQSGMLASEKLVLDFETAHKEGESLVETFFSERMFSAQKSFDETIHRNSRCNFDKPPINRSECVTRPTKTTAMENKAMADVICRLNNSQHKISLTQVMEHRVTDECLSIFNTNGTMVKVQKSKLVDCFTLVPLQGISRYIALVDMGFIWRVSTPTAEDREKADATEYLWKDYAEKVFSIVVARHKGASEIIFVNDPYDIDVCIKDSEHQHRESAGKQFTGGTRNVYMKRDDKLPAPMDFKNFFKNPGNKIRLQQFLKDEFRLYASHYPGIRFLYSVRNSCLDLSSAEQDQVTDYQCLHTEADTILLYIYSQIRRGGDTCPVIIDAEDTDVVALAAYVSHQTEGILGIKRKRDIFDCKALCSKEMAQIIPQLHIMTGADAVSGFFGHGKQSAFKSCVKSQEARQLLLSVGRRHPVTSQVFDNMVKFTIRYIYGDNVSKILAEARARRWQKMKRKSTQRLPPDCDSFDLHVTRVNYQVYVLLGYDKPDAPPSPTDNGWLVLDNRCVPIRHIKPALPARFSDIVSTDNFATGYMSSSDSESDDDSRSSSEEESEYDSENTDLDE